MVRSNILAMITSVFLITDAANAAEIYNKNGHQMNIYGKIASRYCYVSSEDEMINGNQAYARFGFKSVTPIVDHLIGYAKWEYNFAGNNSETGPDAQRGNRTSLAYIGIKTEKYGSLDYGRNYGIVYDALKYTAILPTSGSDIVKSDNFFIGRVANVATYRNSNLFGLVKGLNIGIQYLGANSLSNHFSQKNNSSKDSNFDIFSRSNGTGWGTSVSYEKYGVSVIGTYGTAHHIYPQQDDRLKRYGKKIKQWATGIKYDANNIYLAGNYSENYNSNPLAYMIHRSYGFIRKTQNVQLIAQCQLDCGLRPSIAYIQSKARKEGLKREDINLVKYVSLGATYCFNKNISTSIGYKINQIDDNNPYKINSKNSLTFGLEYRF